MMLLHLANQKQTKKRMMAVSVADEDPHPEWCRWKSNVAELRLNSMMRWANGAQKTKPKVGVTEEWWKIEMLLMLLMMNRMAMKKQQQTMKMFGSMQSWVVRGWCDCEYSHWRLMMMALLGLLMRMMMVVVVVAGVQKVRMFSRNN
jgi:hypothetical protein